MTPTLGFVVGLATEARIVRRAGYLVRIGGGTPHGAARAAAELLAQGAQALVSFGLAGGLDPALRPGDLVIPETVLADGKLFPADPVLAARFGGFTGHTMLAGAEIIRDPAAKREIFKLAGAHAVDLESGAVARIAVPRAVPFAVLRAVCDPAERSLPHLVQTAVGTDGTVKPGRVFASVLRHPSQIRALLSLARDSAAGHRALEQVLRQAVRR